MGETIYKTLDEVASIEFGTRVVKSKVAGTQYPVYGGGGETFRIDSYNRENRVVVGRFALSKQCTRFVSGKFFLNDSGLTVKTKDETVLIQDLLDKLILYSNDLIYNLARGAGQKNLNINDFKELKISFPLNTEEQQRIVKILDKAEEIRTKKKLANKKLDEFLKSTFIDMFGDPVINSNKYKVHKLEKYIKVIGGYAFKSKLFKEDGIPVLRIGNINTGILKLDNVVYWDYDETLQKYMLYPNDLVISLTGTVGKDDYGNVCILPKTCNCYYLNQRNAKLDVNKEMDKYYLCYLLRNKDIKSRLTGISRGVRQANIANSDILNLLVPIPPIDLQKQFAQIVQKVEAQKEKNQKVIEQMDNLFNSLMQQAFNSSL